MVVVDDDNDEGLANGGEEDKPSEVGADDIFWSPDEPAAPPGRWPAPHASISENSAGGR